MSLLKKALTKVAKSPVGKVLDYTSAAFSNPVTFVKSPTSAVEKWRTQSVKENIARIVGTTAIAAGALLGGPALATSAVARAAAGTLAKKAALGTAKATVGTPKKAAVTLLGAGVLTTSPTVRKAAIELPKTVFKTGQAIGTAVEKSPEKEKLGEIAAKAGLIGGGAALAAGALLVVPKVAGAVKDKLTKEPQPITISDATTGATLAEFTPTPTEIPKTTPGQVAAKPKRKRRAKKQPSIQNIVRFKNTNNIAIAR